MESYLVQGTELATNRSDPLRDSKHINEGYISRSVYYSVRLWSSLLLCHVPDSATIKEELFLACIFLNIG